MVYAGDQWVLLPVRDLYDTLMMAMAINAARDMYDRGEKRLDDFYTKYGDFTSPILKDMDAYNNIIGGVRDKINQLYAAGIDPLRSAEGRAAVAQLTRSIPVGDIAKLRQSAETAKEYQKNAGRLAAAGKYNKDFNERYLGYNMGDWDTLGGSGVWGTASPVELESLKDLTEKSFNNRTPHDLTKDEVLSFEGLTYDPRMKYKGFTEKDLLDIANNIAPGLYGTPAYEYYRDLAKQKLIANGIDPTSKNVDAQLSRDIAKSQIEYLVRPLGDLSDWYHSQSLALQRQRNALARQKLSNSGGGGKLTDEPFSYASRLYRSSLANAASTGSQQYNWFDVQNHYGDISKNIYTTQYDFGKQAADTLYKTSKQAAREAYRKQLLKSKTHPWTMEGKLRQWDKDHANDPENKFTSRLMIDIFRNRYEITANDPHTFVLWHGGSTVSGNKNVIQASDSDINRLFGERYIISHTAGNRNVQLNDNAQLRNLITQYGSSNVTITPVNKVYGALMQDDGGFHTYQRVKVTINRGDEEKPIVKYAYYDMGLHSGGTSGGAQMKDYKKQRKTTQGGFVLVGNVGSHYDKETNSIIPNQVGYRWDPNATSQVDSEYNIYPDFNSWLEYGPNDARVNAYLKAKASVNNGAYGPEEIDLEELLEP